MLVRRGGKLFRHVGEVLRQTKLVQASAGIVNDYSTVLKMLLASPAYCATASTEDMKGALRTHRVLVHGLNPCHCGESHVLAPMEMIRRAINGSRPHLTTKYYFSSRGSPEISRLF